MNHLPMRGDGVEAWLKERRDEIENQNNPAWNTIDDLLDRYREMADTGAVMKGIG